MTSTWEIFHGRPERPHSDKRLMGSAPPWRDFSKGENTRGKTYRASVKEVRLVNAALHLRRPLLVTGPPGSGKSSLAYAIDEELQLGGVLKWPINSRTTLNDGLYHYDAVARLRDANLKKNDFSDITQYLRLGPLGTALASRAPRVLLIDEIDKADIDLPNDLLHVLEDGQFVIPELQRLRDLHGRTVDVPTGESGGQTIPICDGVVTSTVFPIIVLTSNGERELPLAFNRRCLRLEIEPPNEDALLEIIQKHLGKFAKDSGDFEKVKRFICAFIDQRQKGDIMATDQLLNLVYLLTRTDAKQLEAEERGDLQNIVFQKLN